MSPGPAGGTRRSRDASRAATLRILALAGAILVSTPACAQHWATINANVNLRAGPGTGYAVLAWLPRGTQVNVAGCVAGKPWCDVTWGRRRGWVSAGYLAGVAQDRLPTVPFDGPAEPPPRLFRGA